MFGWLKKALGLTTEAPAPDPAPTKTPASDNPLDSVSSEEMARWRARSLDALERSDKGVPLQALATHAKMLGKSAELQGRELTVSEGDLVTKITVADDHDLACELDSSMVGVIRVATQIPDSYDSLLRLPINLFTTLGAVRDDPGYAWHVELRLPWYKTNNAWWGVLFPILRFAIEDSGRQLFMALHAMSSQRMIPAAEPSRWTEAELKATQDALTQVGLKGTRSAGELTVKIPVDDGKVAKLRIATTEEHPSGMAGVMVQLVMPANEDRDDISQTAEDLNTAEFEDGQALYHLGAWCDDGQGHLVYMTFLPNALHSESESDAILVNYAKMQVERARWAWQEETM